MMNNPETTAVESMVVIVTPDVCANGQRAFAREQWGKTNMGIYIEELGQGDQSGVRSSI